jgi:Zn-dependent metalloprotease
MAGFKKFVMHVTDERGRTAIRTLREGRAADPSFAATSLEELDAETAAKRIVAQALASESVKGFTAPKSANKEAELRSLGTEAIPLTGTTVVKFRQYYNRIPVYNSLVTVELDDANECVSLNSNLGQPDNANAVAKVAPSEALRVAAKAAGYGSKTIDAVCRLFFYFDQKEKWRLVYIIESVPIKVPRTKASKKAKQGDDHHAPLAMDYVVDAVSGKLVAELPRTPSAGPHLTLADELGVDREIELQTLPGGKKALVDETLGLETYDFAFDDPQVDRLRLPGKLIQNPPVISSAAVSAHANAAVVANFLRSSLKRNNIDGAGGRIVSTVNCVVAAASPDGRQWRNAFWSDNAKQICFTA